MISIKDSTAGEAIAIKLLSYHPDGDRFNPVFGFFVGQTRMPVQS